MKYTRRQLLEAISYWKNRLRELNEENEGDASAEKPAAEKPAAEGKSADAFTVDPEKTEAKAEAKPVGVFDINARMHRLHLGASNKVKKALEKFLNKYDIKSEGKPVKVENSCDNGNAWNMPKEGDKMLITITVSLDRASVKGFRKMVALMKENDREFLNEGFWGDLWRGFKKGAEELKKVGGETVQKMGDTAKEKVINANEKLRRQIGLVAVRMYTEAFCGKALAAEVDEDNIQVGQDNDEKKGGVITFAASFDIR